MLRGMLLLVTALICNGQALAITDIPFEEAHRRAEMQNQDVANAYEDKWDDFNNANNLDEKDGCYQKASGVTQQVLILDKTGMVTKVIFDIENAKSLCFRQSYLHVQFPAPPFAPYYKYLKMN
jgi:hypothetical protein